MRINSYFAGQYAGTHDCEIDFSPGLNVVLGDNETGKSTMINGLYHSLTQSVKLHKNVDKSFIGTQFPTDQANSIDCKVCFEANGQEVSIQKEWDSADGQNSRSVLQYLESGKRLTGRIAEDELKKLLQYGNAFYEKIVFGRQGNEQDQMNWFSAFLGMMEIADPSILDAKSRISSAESALASGGFPEDKFLQKLDDLMAELDGHWNVEADRPEMPPRGKSRWTNGKGTILTAYYEFEDAEISYDEAEKKIENLKVQREQYNDLKDQLNSLNSQLEQLQNQYASIVAADAKKEKVKRLGEEIEKLTEVSKNWPELQRECQTMQELQVVQREKDAREQASRLTDILRQNDECDKRIDELTSMTNGKDNIQEDLKNYRLLSSEVSKDYVQLKAGRFHAKISLNSGYLANMETADGVVAEATDYYEGNVQGYARVSLPDVGEIVIAPEQVDVDALKQSIKDKKEKMQDILRRYGVEDESALASAERDYWNAKNGIDAAKTEQTTLLCGKTAGEIQAELNSIETDPTVIVYEDLDMRIRSALCGKQERSVDARLAVLNNLLRENERCYGTYKKLQVVIREKEEELSRANRDLGGIDATLMTEDEYERKRKELKELCDKCQENRDTSARSLQSAEIAAEELDLDLIQREREECNTKYLQAKNRYKRLRRIRDDFIDLRGIQAEQYDGFYNLFNDYLTMIAGDDLKVTEDEGIVSKGYKLDKTTLLSQGTRKTILLAFRLALLKSYFVDESAVVVLDDIMLDMDPTRREGAAALLRNFSKQNQVILTTCDPEIAHLLGGNLIRM